ncbi:galactose-3-O-sulfotransferase 2-like isoform X2 [Babylonia areolata]|uniref:galactose-3-O-sulfotransferase 2-like isoform X2 n=1 Tax=Babylonia areolata TaxID=304850 RepID=UPI003FD01EB9
MRAAISGTQCAATLLKPHLHCVNVADTAVKTMLGKASSHRLFFLVLAWTTLFIVIMIVSRHVTSSTVFDWLVRLREASLNGRQQGRAKKDFNKTWSSSLEQREEEEKEEGYFSPSGATLSADVPTRVTGTVSARLATSQQNRSVEHSSRGFRRVEGNITNIVFIKVHKSGSTTVANVLARYALSHHLNVALPRRTPGTSGFNYFPPGHDLQDHVIPRPRNEHFHVLFNHMVYNRSALDRLMPGGAFYCAIMREPVSRFVSAANYYNGILPPRVRHYLLVGPSEQRTTLTGPGTRPENGPPGEPTTLKTLLGGPEGPRMERCRLLYNSLSWDTGLPCHLHVQPAAVMEHALRLEQELDLMMVMEHFHESLILLKRRAGLNMKDVVHLKLNSARVNRVRKLSEPDKETLKTWLAADYYLYNFFYRKFQSEVRKEGESFWREVEVFRKILNITHSFCGPSGQEGVLTVPASFWNAEFALSRQDCRLMSLKETVFQRRLIERAWSRLAESGES